MKNEKQLQRKSDCKFTILNINRKEVNHVAHEEQSPTQNAEIAEVCLRGQKAHQESFASDGSLQRGGAQSQTHQCREGFANAVGGSAPPRHNGERAREKRLCCDFGDVCRS